MVTVPSAEDILGDKLTAFAPNTTGIPYYKNGRSCSMEIAKQLYDVGRLFENVSGLQITAKAFRKIAVVELSYRSWERISDRSSTTSVRRHSVSPHEVNPEKVIST